MTTRAADVRDAETPAAKRFRRSRFRRQVSVCFGFGASIAFATIAAGHLWLPRTQQLSATLGPIAERAVIFKMEYDAFTSTDVLRAEFHDDSLVADDLKAARNRYLASVNYFPWPAPEFRLRRLSFVIRNPDGTWREQIRYCAVVRWDLALWALSPFILLGSISLSRLLNERRRRLPYSCAICGYDLRATPDRCPECGTPLVPSPGTPGEG